MQSLFCFRTFGAAIGVASLAFMMTAGSHSPAAIGIGLGGLLATLLSRLAPRPKGRPAGKPAALQPAAEATAPNSEGLGEIIAAYRAGGVHPMMVADVRKAG